MTGSITVVDYGVGNLFSVRRSLEYCGCDEVVLSSRPEDIASAHKLVLPGVGAFEDGMRGLHDRGLIEAILRYSRSGRPLLGICLGMQMLATESEEFGVHAGLNLIPGRVVPIPRQGIDGTRLKVPFIGWSPITVSDHENDRSILASYEPNQSVYLVHSFHVKPTNSLHLLATYDFSGNAVCAAIRRDNITGVQFHPEKSGAVGLKIVSAFVNQR
jgi:imidazole glycerol-phosphate synthase subunit HisH